jgi:hypothetical protein
MRTLTLALVFSLIACKSAKTDTQESAPKPAETPKAAEAPKPAEAAKPAADVGGEGTAMALEEGKGHPTSIVDDSDYEAKLLGQYERANKQLVEGVGRDCGELAADVRRQRYSERNLSLGLKDYAKAHAGIDDKVEKKLKPKLDEFMKTAAPTFTHCKGNKAFLSAVTDVE